MCQFDGECCSNNCFKGPESTWKNGVCVPREDGEVCHKMFYNGCINDSDCCSSLFCEKKLDLKVGTCKPYTALKLLNAKNQWTECFENWYDYCINDNGCCSGNCHKFTSSMLNYSTTSFGVCLPKIQVVTEEFVQNILKNDSHPGQTNNREQRRKERSISEKKVICYLGSWANYKPGDGKFVRN